MRKVTATIGKDKYITNINTNSEHTVIADEPEEKGGLNKGPMPGEYLATALGACTCITMRMYADRKEWDVKSITVTVTYERDREARTSSFLKEIKIEGNLDEAQTKRILQIGDRCPIHFTLSNPISIESKLI